MNEDIYPERLIAYRSGDDVRVDHLKGGLLTRTHKDGTKEVWKGSGPMREKVEVTK